MQYKARTTGGQLERQFFYEFLFLLNENLFGINPALKQEVKKFREMSGSRLLKALSGCLGRLRIQILSSAPGNTEYSST